MSQTTIVYSIATKILPSHLLKVFTWTQNHEPSETELITEYSKGTFFAKGEIEISRMELFSDLTYGLQREGDVLHFEATSHTIENPFVSETRIFKLTKTGLYWDARRNNGKLLNRISNTCIESIWRHEQVKETKYKSSTPISVSMFFFNKNFTVKMPSLLLENILNDFPEQKNLTFYQNKQICKNCFSPRRLVCLTKKSANCSIAATKKAV